jgi:hypothetical protein
MHLVLHINLFKQLLETRHQLFDKDDETSLIHDIFGNITKNKDVKVFLSAQIIDYLENSYTDKQEKRYIREQLKYLAKSGFTMPTTETDLTAQFIEVAKKCTQKCVIPIVKTDFEVENDKITLKNDKIVAISEMQKPNKHWQRIKLAAYNTFTVRYLDFENRTQIASFFRTIFTTTNIEKVQIFDRYMQNIVKHNNFQYLSDNNIPTEYYSLKLPSKNLTNGDLNDISLVTSSNIQFFTTEIEDNIHERTLAFSNILIETNDDFSQLKPERQTWRIDVTYSHVLYAALLAKTSHFTNYIF